nr:hypothetical protein [Tanacetum cinerariifolium]
MTTAIMSCAKESGGLMPWRQAQRNLSQKKVVSEQVENVMKLGFTILTITMIRVNLIMVEIRYTISGKKFMDDNVCNVSPFVTCLDDECVNVDAHSQDNYDQFCSMNDTNHVTNEESSPKISHIVCCFDDDMVEKGSENGSLQYVGSLWVVLKLQGWRARAEYARVLVEFDVSKGFKEEICIQDEKCSKFKGTSANNEQDKEKIKESNDVVDVDGFTQVKYKKRRKDKVVGLKVEEQMQKDIDSGMKQGKKWTSQDTVDKAVRTSQNKFAPLDDMSEKHDLGLLKDDENPWCLLGDLNVTIKVEEYSSRGSSINEDMQEFIDCINEVDVEDIHSSGMFYTWIKSPNKPTSSIMKKLDRIMVNQCFMDEFGSAMGHFRPFMTSDHCLAVLSITRCLKKKKKSFRFLNFIIEKDEFILIVKEWWEEAIECHNMFKVVKKLKKLKHQLKRLAWKNGSLQERVMICRDKLKNGQILMKSHPFDDQLKKEEGECLSLYMEAVGDEESFMLQKAKLDWISKEDRNAKFFIKSLRKISHDDAKYMVRDVTKEEIKEAMFGIGDNKAPGPDGYTSSFFKKAWKELLKGYNCKNGPSRCALKIDIAKAYDTVNWIFLEKILKCFGFHMKMVEWIMTCVSSASFTIGINGERHGFLRSRRGLRQGDPISPYLFTIVMEVFSLILARKVERSNVFKSYKGCRELKMTHLSFAYDLFVFCHGDVNSIYVIKDALLEFSKVSGLLPNLGKSVIFFGSVKENDRMVIMQALPFKADKLSVKYLGIYLLAKRLGIKDCKYLVDKVKNKVMDWKNRSLSYAGRLQLIALVLSAMQAYWAAVVKIPKSIVNDIDRVLKKILWSNNEMGKGISKIWRIISKKESLWVKWVDLVKLKGKSFGEVSEDRDDSCTWKALFDIRSKVRYFFVHSVGNGEDIDVWSDNWCSLGNLKQFMSTSRLSNARIQDSCALVDMIDNGSWRWPEELYQQAHILSRVPVIRLNENKNDEVQ